MSVARAKDFYDVFWEGWARVLPTASELAARPDSRVLTCFNRSLRFGEHRHEDSLP